MEITEELRETTFIFPVHTLAAQLPVMAKKDCLLLLFLCTTEPLFTPKDLSHFFLHRL